MWSESRQTPGWLEGGVMCVELVGDGLTVLLTHKLLLHNSETALKLH
jgi:hypothetical protein